jgi:hypothetical protein
MADLLNSMAVARRTGEDAATIFAKLGETKGLRMHPNAAVPASAAAASPAAAAPMKNQ